MLLTPTLISVSNKGPTGEFTIRSECFRSMEKRKKSHSLSVRQGHHTGSVQFRFMRTQVQSPLITHDDVLKRIGVLNHRDTLAKCRPLLS